MPFLLVAPAGVGMVYGLAESDGVPLEVARQDDRVVGVRLEFTDDIALLEGAGEGRWVEIGLILIGPGGRGSSDGSRCHPVGRGSGP